MLYVTLGIWVGMAKNTVFAIMWCRRHVLCHGIAGDTR